MEEGHTVRGVERGHVSLRRWLDKPNRSVDLLECLHIFRQIVEIVNLAHSQGVVVHNVRPSCFVMSSSNRVSFIESASCSSSGSDSYENDFNQHSLPSPQNLQKQQSRKIEAEERKKTFPLELILPMEISWYCSPEEDEGAPSSFCSDVYRLGVLLFELFCTFSLTEEKFSTMSNLKHRVLPPHLLLKWPKEASFCLWLLHPQPSTRPKLSEVLHSEFLNEPRDHLEEREALIKLTEDIEEQEVLLEFLLQVQQRKLVAADKLHGALSCLSSDIGEVMEQQMILNKKGLC
ncbi:unnamed protein product, partial [Vitis vinifera]